MIEFKDFNSNTSERETTFDNIKLNIDWCLKHLGIKTFILASVIIKIQILNPWSDHPALRISGVIYNEDKQPILEGQILPALMDSPLQYNQRFLQLADAWLKYHMNDNPACTVTQFDCLCDEYQRGRLSIGDMLSREARKNIAPPDENPDDNYIPIPKETLEFLQTKIHAKGRLV